MALLAAHNLGSDQLLRDKRGDHRGLGGVAEERDRRIEGTE